MTDERLSFWDRIKAAGRASGLNAGVRSWTKEINVDYRAAEARAATLREGLPEPDARLALLGEASTVFARAAALRDEGAEADRQRRRATRMIGTLTHEAAQLGRRVGEPDLSEVYDWQSDAIAALQPRSHWTADRDTRVAEVEAAFRIYEREADERTLDPGASIERGF